MGVAVAWARASATCGVGVVGGLCVVGVVGGLCVVGVVGGLAVVVLARWVFSGSGGVRSWASCGVGLVRGRVGSERGRVRSERARPSPTPPHRHASHCTHVMHKLAATALSASLQHKCAKPE